MAKSVWLTAVNKKHLSAVLGGLLLGLAASYVAYCLPQTQLYKIKLPPGFGIELYATGVSGARSMTMGNDGTLYVGTAEAGGSVYAIPDRNHDGHGDEVVPILRGLFCPNGVEYRQGSLYVAEINRILRFDNVDHCLAADGKSRLGKPVVVTANFADERWHGYKYIRFGPDNGLYIGVGAPCNVCVSKDPRFATIMRLPETGSPQEIYAAGVRNTVGFDWHPQTKELWFTDNGRDWLGDNRPPDELNRCPGPGLHFGFPYRHGKDISDPEFGSQSSPPPATAPEPATAPKPRTSFTPATVELGPHVASLGMKFYTGSQFPAPYRENSIFIAEHGSWNRSKPIGYRITRVNLADLANPTYEVFAAGWRESNGNVWGRPVDILVHPDGSLLVSDDRGGNIYRIFYRRQPGQQ